MAVDRPEIAALVGPFVPDAHAVLVVLATVLFGYVSARKAMGSPKSTAAEADFGAAVGSGHA